MTRAAQNNTPRLEVLTEAEIAFISGGMLCDPPTPNGDEDYCVHPQ